MGTVGKNLLLPASAKKILAGVNNQNFKTYSQDGRKNIPDLYAKYFSLLETDDWQVEKITDSKTVWRNQKITLPILAFKTKLRGPAIYLLAGIHGEEPTGPNAIAESIEVIKAIGQKRPVVLLPLCNPLGYFRNWRYLNKKTYLESPNLEGSSVGDAEHLLLDSKLKNTTRRKKPVNRECFVLTRKVLEYSKAYPPTLSLDFHGDTLIPKGYIYSQGKLGEKDLLAVRLLKILESNGIPIERDGKTRFGETIKNGVVKTQSDGSIDELISAKKIIVDHKIVSGPNAKTVLVLETPDADLPLKKRVDAYRAVIFSLQNLKQK